MKYEIPVLSSVFMVLALAVTQPASSQEQADSQQRTRQAQAVSKAVYEVIEAAQLSIDNEDHETALVLLQKAYAQKKLTEYERSNILNYIGNVQYRMELTEQAIETYETRLSIPTLELQGKKQTLYLLAQLNSILERHDTTVRHLDEWFELEKSPASEPYIFLAQTLYQLDRFTEMIPAISMAINIAEKNGKPLKEHWLVLLNFAYFQQEDFEKVRDTQKLLLEGWPKERYWLTLAGAYTELDDEPNVLAAYDVAYQQGLLLQEAQLVTMARLYMQHGLPFRAGALIEQQMSAGLIEHKEENYRLLSQAWMQAQEDEKAIPALTEAAKLDNKGEVDLMLGNLYLSMGQHAECADSVRSGISKGGIRSSDNAYISLGMCLYNLQQYASARNAFNSTSRSPKYARIVAQWTRVIDQEIARNEQIANAELAAQRLLETVTERRQSAEKS